MRPRSGSATDRGRCSYPNLVWPAPPLRSEMIFGKHSLIGSIRRECLDHLIVFNAEHLGRILAKYAAYYNEVRTHVSLGKDAPYTRQIERLGDVVPHPILGGLHHRYARI